MFIKENEVSHPKVLTAVRLKSKSLVQNPGCKPKLQVTGLCRSEAHMLKSRPMSSVLCCNQVFSPQSYVQIKSQCSSIVFSPQSCVGLKPSVLNSLFEIESKVLSHINQDHLPFMFKSNPKAWVPCSNQVQSSQPYAPVETQGLILVWIETQACS